MPDRPPHACSRCGRATTNRGRCDACAPRDRAPVDDRRANSAERGYDRKWRRLRAWVLSEEPTCRRCAAEGTSTPATDVDHIVPKSSGGTDDVSNLQPLCHSCHSVKTRRENA